MCGVSSFAFMGTNAHILMQAMQRGKGSSAAAVAATAVAGGTTTAPSWQRSSHWAAAPTHLLSRRCSTAPSAPSIATFHADLSAHQLCHLWDHIVGNQVIMPGAAYMEMALAVASQLLGGGPSATVALTCAKVPAPLLLERWSAGTEGATGAAVAAKLPQLQCQVDCATGQVTITSLTALAGAQGGEGPAPGAGGKPKGRRGATAAAASTAVHFTAKASLISCSQEQQQQQQQDWGATEPAAHGAPLVGASVAMLLAALRRRVAKAVLVDLTSSNDGVEDVAGAVGAAAVASLAAQRPKHADGWCLGADLLDCSLQLGQVFIMGSLQGMYVPSGLDALVAPSHQDMAAGLQPLGSAAAGVDSKAYVSVVPWRSKDSSQASSEYRVLQACGGAPLLSISGMHAKSLKAAPAASAGTGAQRQEQTAAEPSPALMYNIEWQVAQVDEEDASQPSGPAPHAPPPGLRLEPSSASVGGELSLCPPSDPGTMALASLMSAVAGLSAAGVPSLEAQLVGAFDSSNEVSCGSSSSSLQTALLRGLLKTAAAEERGTEFSVATRSPAMQHSPAAAVAQTAALVCAPKGRPVAVPGPFGHAGCAGQLLLPTLVPEPVSGAAAAAAAGPHRLVPRPYGSLDSLAPEPLDLQAAMAPGKVLVAVKAVGINFRDVLNVSVLQRNARARLCTGFSDAAAVSVCTAQH